MGELIYQTLAKIGYTHPLHPILTHLPMGLVIGAFVFGVGARLFRLQALAPTARHCAILALIAILPTAALGYLDWQHRFSGAWIFPLKMKLLLASLLLVLLLVAARMGRSAATGSRNPLGIYTLCLATVIAVGYFGGELVYGKRMEVAAVPGRLAQRGAVIFSQNCSQCHFADSSERKVGPGLQGLFKREALPESGRPVTEENIRRQLQRPYKLMPSFADLTEEQVESIVAFLKTL